MRGQIAVLIVVVGLLAALAAVGMVGSQRAEAQTPGDTWEYITLLCSEAPDSADVYCGGFDDVNLLMTERHLGNSLMALTQTLNIYGTAGWELVSVTTVPTPVGAPAWQAFMKRRAA